jgi:hypothetical protein
MKTRAGSAACTAACVAAALLAIAAPCAPARSYTVQPSD